MSDAAHRIPKPIGEYPRRFERMMLSLLQQQWGTEYLRLHGRSGQRQDGVDILGVRVGLTGRSERVGVQCAVRKDKIELSKITEDLRAADAGFPASKLQPDGTIKENKEKLDKIYIVTSADTDSRIQDAVAKLSDDRVASGLCPVVIMFWEDVEQLLFEHQRVYARFYPDIFRFAVEWHNKHRCCAALTLAFLGRGLRSHEMFYPTYRVDEHHNIKDFCMALDCVIESKDVLNGGALFGPLDVLARKLDQYGRTTYSYPGFDAFSEVLQADQWIVAFSEVQQPTEKAYMNAGTLLAHLPAPLFYLGEEAVRRERILEQATICEPQNESFFVDLYNCISWRHPLGCGQNRSHLWAGEFFNEWSVKLGASAWKAFAPIPNDPDLTMV